MEKKSNRKREIQGALKFLRNKDLIEDKDLYLDNLSIDPDNKSKYMELLNRYYEILKNKELINYIIHCSNDKIWKFVNGDTLYKSKFLSFIEENLDFLKSVYKLDKLDKGDFLDYAIVLFLKHEVDKYYLYRRELYKDKKNFDRSVLDDNDFYNEFLKNREKSKRAKILYSSLFCGVMFDKDGAHGMRVELSNYFIQKALEYGINFDINEKINTYCDCWTYKQNLIEAAVGEGFLDVMSMKLMERYKDINPYIQDEFGNSAFLLLIAKGRKEDVRGSDGCMNYKNYLPVFKKMLELQSTTKENINLKGFSGNTALHIACARHDLDYILPLLKNGADLTVKNNNGQTPLDVLNLSKEDRIRIIYGFVLPLTEEQFLNFKNVATRILSIDNGSFLSEFLIHDVIKKKYYERSLNVMKDAMEHVASTDDEILDVSSDVILRAIEDVKIGVIR